jgi:hypothetical protein
MHISKRDSCYKIWMIIGCLLCLGGMHATAQTFSSPRGVQVQTTIHASAAEVWAMLLDFQKYPTWNPYIRSIEGEAKQGKRLHIVIDGKEKVYDFKAKVLEVKPDRAFAWGGGALFFFKARHYFRIEPMPDSTVLFTQGEAWGGLFGKSYGKKVYQEAIANFDKMNVALGKQFSLDN